jgi:hypothetical protein
MTLQFKVVVYNSAGEAVVLLFDGSAQNLPQQIKYSGTSFVAGSGSLVMDYGTLLSSGVSALAWSGVSQSGQSVESGVYTIKTEMVDSFGKVSEYAQQIQVLAPPSEAVITIYNSAGELVYYEALSNTGGSVTGLDLDQPVLVLESAASPGLKLNGTLHSNAGAKPWSWDGKNQQGAQVSPGVYEIHLSAGQGSVVMAKSVQVMAPAGGELAALKPVAAPNPVSGAWLNAGMPLSVRFLPSSGTLSGRLFNLAGELVASSAAPGSSGEMKFYPGPMASGVYIVALDYLNGFGARSRLNLKLVILR